MPPKRKNIPMGVKLEAALLLLGFKPGEEVEWDHFPALALRPVNEAGTDYDPPQLDPRHLRPLRPAAHLAKTTGRKGESKFSSSGGGDTSQAAKVKRLREAEAERAQELMRKRLLATTETVEGLDEALGKNKRDKPKTKWPKRSFPQGRGFPKRQKRGKADGETTEV